MEINYYEKYLKYKTKYLELKAQLGGEPRFCHELEKEECYDKLGCTNRYDKQGNWLGCKQKYCWGRSKSFCKNAGLQGKNGTIWGTSGCEYDKQQGCRMKCGHIEGEEDCNKLNECQWNNEENKCVPKENPCRDIQKDKELSTDKKTKKCLTVRDEQGNNLCKVELFSRRCVPKS